MARATASDQAMRAALLIVAVAVVSLYPAAVGEFVAWDDPTTVAKPPGEAPSLSKLRDYWTRPQAELYVPVTYTAWAVLAELAKVPVADAEGVRLNPYVFHTANLVLHVVNALLAWLILRLLLRERGAAAGEGVWAAAVGAMVFAVHPVQVEAVAWVTGMKDVLSGTLALGTVLCYLRWAVGAKWRRTAYAVATVLFILAMLAKPGSVAVPLVVLALDRWGLGRPWRSVFVGVLPWIALAVPCVVLTKLVQPARFVGDVVPLWQRPLIAADALAFYLYKLIWPRWLGPVYGRTPGEVMGHHWMYWTWVAPAAVAVVLWKVRKRASLLPAAGGVFVAGLLPVLGFVSFDFQLYSTVADRFLYLSMLGVALAAAWAVWRIASLPTGGTWVRGACAILILILGVRSWLQAWTWHDSLRLFENAVRVRPDSAVMRTLLAGQLNSLGRYREAYDQTMQVAKDQPRYGGAYIQAGRALWGMGRRETAVEAYRAAVECRPDYAPSHAALAQALLQLGRTTEAEAEFTEARRLSKSE